ncbi:hypothetical protein [Lysobacter sp. Hz 25]|uniref:hypothetical protein n=1 Tax=Lysobacter sp. Hz 25 TaxID=3383698 RepID=UPI0038D3EE38
MTAQKRPAMPLIGQPENNHGIAPNLSELGNDNRVSLNCAALTATGVAQTRAFTTAAGQKRSWQAQSRGWQRGDATLLIARRMLRIGRDQDKA